MSEEPESPVATPDPEAPDAEGPTPEETQPETEQACPLVQPGASSEAPSRGAPTEAVEPTLGLQDFLAVHPMKPAAEAMLKAWMRRMGIDSAGHYTHAEWEDAYQAMLRAS